MDWKSIFERFGLRRRFMIGQVLWKRLLEDDLGSDDLLVELTLQLVIKSSRTVLRNKRVASS
jgi:hypothetical protein